MEILENQHQRSCPRDDLERFTQLAHHPFARRAGNLALQSGLLLRPYERRKLNQPGRGVRRQGVDDERPRSSTGELPESLEQRIVRFLTTKTFDRLTARDRYAPSGCAGGLKRIDQARLPDTRFPDDEHHLTPAAHRRRE